MYKLVHERRMNAILAEMKFTIKPGQVVIMDNASFHKSQKTIDLIESVGCRVIFSPPYSPDLNPIEKFWANLKRWIGQHNDEFSDLFETIDYFFSMC